MKKVPLYTLAPEGVAFDKKLNVHHFSGRVRFVRYHDILPLLRAARELTTSPWGRGGWNVFDKKSADRIARELESFNYGGK